MGAKQNDRDRVRIAAATCLQDLVRKPYMGDDEPRSTRDALSSGRWYTVLDLMSITGHSRSKILNELALLPIEIRDSKFRRTDV